MASDPMKPDSTVTQALWNALLEHRPWERGELGGRAFASIAGPILARHRIASTGEDTVLREALKRHHEWHLAQEEAEDGTGGAEAYADSALCDQTVRALAATPSPDASNPKQQDRSRAAATFISAGNSELEPDGQDQGSIDPDRKGGSRREIGGRDALFAGGLQRSERDVFGGEQQDDQVTVAGASQTASPAIDDGTEPFGFWVEQKYAEPALLRKPAYIPEPSDIRTVTPLYRCPRPADASNADDVVERQFAIGEPVEVVCDELPEQWRGDWANSGAFYVARIEASGDSINYTISDTWPIKRGFNGSSDLTDGFEPRQLRSRRSPVADEVSSRVLDKGGEG